MEMSMGRIPKDLDKVDEGHEIGWAQMKSKRFVRVLNFTICGNGSRAIKERTKRDGHKGRERGRRRGLKLTVGRGGPRKVGFGLLWP